MTDAAEAIIDQGADAPEPTIEDAAKEMGWRPKEEFKGDPDKWVEAETFVKRGEEILPILKAQSKKDREALKAATDQIAEMKKTFGEFKQYHSQTEKRAYERAMKDLEARQAQAVEDNDLKAVREITREMTDLSKDVRTDDSGNDLAKTQDEAFAVWVQDNAWFKTDAALRGAAIALADEIAADGLIDPAKQMAEVSKRIKAEFPHKFENARRAAPAAVEGGSPPRKAGKGWSDLPALERQTYERWIKAGIATREQLLKDYQW